MVATDPAVQVEVDEIGVWTIVNGFFLTECCGYCAVFTTDTVSPAACAVCGGFLVTWNRSTSSYEARPFFLVCDLVCCRQEASSSGRISFGSGPDSWRL